MPQTLFYETSTSVALHYYFCTLSEPQRKAPPPRDNQSVGALVCRGARARLEGNVFSRNGRTQVEIQGPGPSPSDRKGTLTVETTLWQFPPLFFFICFYFQDMPLQRPMYTRCWWNGCYFLLIALPHIGPHDRNQFAAISSLSCLYLFKYQVPSF